MTAATSETPTEAIPRLTRTDWAPVPRVNLLPNEILEGRRFRRVQRLLAVAVLTCVAGAGATVWWAQEGRSQAETELADERTVTSQLNVQKNSYSEVPRLLAAVEAATTARQQAMATDVSWYSYLNRLALATGDDVTLSSIKVTMTDPTAAVPASGAAAPTTIGPVGIGTISFTGSAGAFRKVSAWLESVEGVAGIDASRLASAVLQEDATPVTSGGTGAVADAEGNGTGTPAASEGPVDFTTEAVLTDDALSRRYERKAS
jgi:hypothetical protein